MQISGYPGQMQIDVRMVIVQGDNMSHAGNHNIELTGADLRCLQSTMNSEVFCYLFIEAMRDILRPVNELRLMTLCESGGEMFV